MTDRPVRVGVVGVGSLGQWHARVYSELDAIELVGVCDADPERAREISERYGTRVFGSVAALAEEVDAASVAVPMLITAVVRMPAMITGATRGRHMCQRIWRQEGLKVPKHQPGRGRLWLNDGFCIRFRPLHDNHVWSCDFVSVQTDDGRALKLLTALYEYTRQCLAIKVGRRTRAHDVLEVLADLFVWHGPLQYLRSDNGPEFTAHFVRRWLARLGVQTLYIEPGSTWENGYNESFNAKLRDEFMSGEIFYTLSEAVVLVEQWRRLYNTFVACIAR